MALTVSMPQLGESVTEGTIARWLKQPGEPVARYESIAEVASDKVNAEIPAPADGIFGEIIAPEGSVVSVGQPICTIEQGAGASPEVPVAAPAAPAAEQPVVAVPAIAVEAVPPVREVQPVTATAAVAAAPPPAMVPLAPATGAPAPCSMVQIGCPTLTTEPSVAMISPKVPSAGAGISALTLSLATSAIDS